MPETKKIDDGGPAFPGIRKVGRVSVSDGGLTKREVLAAFALAGQMAHPQDDGLPDMPKARLCVKAADMLIAALKETTKS